MAWTKPGPGRTKGSKNKRTVEMAEKLRRLNFDPIRLMVELAKDVENPPELRGKMAAELAGYLFPKRKAVEHSTTDGAPLFVIMGAQPAATAEDWAKQHSPEAVH